MHFFLKIFTYKIPYYTNLSKLNKSNYIFVIKFHLSKVYYFSYLLATNFDHTLMNPKNLDKVYVLTNLPSVLKADFEVTIEIRIAKILLAII